MNLRRVWVQCVKELVEFRRDRLTVGLAFALPVAMLLIFGLAIRLQIKNIPVAVQDFDRSPFSRDFIARIDASQELVAFPEPLGPLAHGAPRCRQRARIDRDPARYAARPRSRAPGADPESRRRDRRRQRADDQADSHRDERLRRRDVRTAVPASLVRRGSRCTSGFGSIPGGNEALFIVPGVYAVILAMYPTCSRPSRWCATRNAGRSFKPTRRDCAPPN